MSTLPGWSFDTVLVANRGEIARRVIRTARRLGLRTVSVYSEADLAAPHVREADEAVCIGPAPAISSYLNVPAIISAITVTGAGATHPGYGFLAENAQFAAEVEAAGAAFVGPTPGQLADLAAKHTARALARAAGVPLAPGTGLLGSAADAVAAAARIGFPVMVKATGGGGGIGLQACYSPEEVTEAFARVERLAAANFGTAGVFLERLIRPARHVEVQVFGDGAGNVAVLGDRDCSLQRRNQKVVEEAPAPGIPAALRRRLHDAARDLAASVSYRSAGTVEFVYDPLRGEASFLEVNARLQVEHPVTEMVLGVDLVEQMLRLAGQGPAGSRSSSAAGTCRAAMPSRRASTPRTPARAASPAPASSPRRPFPGGPGSAWTRGSRPGWRCRPTTTRCSRRSSPRPSLAARRSTSSARHCARPASRASLPTSACCAP